MVYGIDLTGCWFGRLYVVEKNGKRNDSVTWLCRCDCGNEYTTLTGSLTSGRANSCGCLRRENTSKMFKSHGMRNTRIYGIWSDMKKRCDNANHSHYEQYGGRGISYCERWNDFSNFHEDMIETYQEHLTIDRINFNGNYEKDNCRWVTMDVQWNNTRKCVFIEINGEVDTVKNMCRKYNSKYDLVVRWIKKGKDPWEMIQKYKLS